MRRKRSTTTARLVPCLLVLGLVALLVSCVSVEVRRLTEEHGDEMREAFARYFEVVHGGEVYGGAQYGDVEALREVVTERRLRRSFSFFGPVERRSVLVRYEIKKLEVLEYSPRQAKILVYLDYWAQAVNLKQGTVLPVNQAMLDGYYDLLWEDGKWKVDGVGDGEHRQPSRLSVRSWLTPLPTRVPPPMVTLILPLAPSLGDTWTRPTDGMTMVYVPAGEFAMGSTDADLDAVMEECPEPDCARFWFGNEQPQHTVYLDGFWIDRTEVTNAQYDQCAQVGVCRERRPSCLEDLEIGLPDQPAACLTWLDARAYCEWVGGRLPSEAEWEYAARGPEGYIYPWGDAFDPLRLNYCDVNCPRDWQDGGYDDGYETTAPVGSFPGGASWCGALDMAGNVWEYTNDRYAEDYYSRSPYRNPPGDEREVEWEWGISAIRGGGWANLSWGVRSAIRDWSDNQTFNPVLGFRCTVSGVVPTGE